jgi:uncharacterized membrane protein YjfL (UPF0719 family)
MIGTNPKKNESPNLVIRVIFGYSIIWGAVTRITKLMAIWVIQRKPKKLNLVIIAQNRALGSLAKKWNLS